MSGFRVPVVQSANQARMRLTYCQPTDVELGVDGILSSGWMVHGSQIRNYASCRSDSVDQASGVEHDTRFKSDGVGGSPSSADSVGVRSRRPVSRSGPSQGTMHDVCGVG